MKHDGDQAVGTKSEWNVRCDGNGAGGAKGKHDVRHNVRDAKLNATTNPHEFLPKVV